MKNFADSFHYLKIGNGFRIAKATSLDVRTIIWQSIKEKIEKSTILLGCKEREWQIALIKCFSFAEKDL